MDGHVEYVRPVVEDPLAAIAMVVVDIEDRDTRGPLVAESLGGDGCIVDVAIATGRSRFAQGLTALNCRIQR